MALTVVTSVVTSAAEASDERDAAPPPCTELEAFHLLDFWIGDWDVYRGDEQVGTNRIDKVLDGCAVMERWESGGGGQGMSLFYLLPSSGEWKQVWVTDRATSRGGVKEKTLVEYLARGGLRFQGVVPLPTGGSYLDRTSLTPEQEGRVRQLIEISTDGGANWRAVFDATYVPVGGDPPSRQDAPTGGN